MLTRVLEPEVMDTAADAAEYDAMDHAAVNRAFAADFLAFAPSAATVLDVGTGTALIPVELCRQSTAVRVVAVDAAEAMLVVGRRHVAAAGLAGRISLQRAAAQTLPFAAGEFAAVVSNSLIHHLPDPALAVAEMHRVCAAGGHLFVRDLARPGSEAELATLVDLYAGGATPRQRQLFADSLRAALTLDDMSAIVSGLGYAADTVTMTSDRHWTWATRRV